MEALSGIKGDNSVKIVGPDLDELEKLAEKTKDVLEHTRGIVDVGIFHIRGQSHLQFRVDPYKCQRWGVSTADVNNVVSSALGATALSQMVEGEKLFDISVRWPKRLRSSETDILDIPVDIINNSVMLSSGPSVVPSSTGYGIAAPNVRGAQADTTNQIASNSPRLKLKDLVSPVGEDGSVDPEGQYERHGASTIYREQGKRLIAIKFGVRDRDLGVPWTKPAKRPLTSTRPRTTPSGAASSSRCRTRWDGSSSSCRFRWRFILILHYACFNSFMDAIVVLSNVFDVAVGGIWALYLTGTNFSVSAAVGFISLFGIAVMEGLLMISYFNALRAEGCSSRGDRAGGFQARAARDDHGNDGHSGPLAGGLVDEDRVANAAAFGHRRRGRNGFDAVCRPLFDARPVQFLWKPQAA